VQPTERRPLGPPVIAGNFLVRVHKRAKCPACGRSMGTHAVRDIDDGGIALTCDHCAADVLVVETLEVKTS
jgi:hypothetical protein